MAYFFSPLGNTQIIDANGDPLVGGTIETYLAGTTTPETTYTDDTGGTAQGVVMTLNSLGYPTNGPVWLLGGVPLKFIVKNALGVVQSTFDDVSGIGDTATAADQWVLYGAAPTYISATSFSVVGDQTNTFQVRRRLKTINTGGTIYSTIRTSAFAAGVTTVTVFNDSGVLDSGLSQVSYGLISATNTSLPVSVLTAGTAVVATSGSAIDFTSIPSWVRRINVSLVGVSVTGVDSPAIQLGTGGVPTTTGYKTQNQLVGGTANPSTASLLVGVVGGGAGNTLHGNIQIVKLTGNSYSMSSVVAVLDGNAGVIVAAGSVTLAGALDMIRLLITGGQTFDAGSVNIIYE